MGTSTTHGTKDAHAKPCNGSMAECNEDSEHLMESEISRRFLEQKKYVSPGALKRDQLVCNGGGRAYPNRSKVAITFENVFAHHLVNPIVFYTFFAYVLSCKASSVVDCMFSLFTEFH
ncbi:hypothetical protein L1049_003503 [Liquidambar formosana]|uniref:Uncharacterized protein n=1 Tax=Liquidambar formosana TaxID=63359 RepID=A0AAP0N7L0_LIQFO